MYFLLIKPYSAWALPNILVRIPEVRLYSKKNFESAILIAERLRKILYLNYQYSSNSSNHVCIHMISFKVVDNECTKQME